MKENKKVNIAIIFANFGPYHLARFSCFSRYCSYREWKAIGIELARSELEYPWQIKNEDISFMTIISLIKNKPLEQASFYKLIEALNTALTKVNPDVIAIAGYSRPVMLAALLWSIWHRKLAILLSESKENDAPRFWWQEKLKSKLLKLYKAALVGGKSHQKYLEKLKMAPDAIFSGYNVVDNDVFTPNKIQLLPKPIAKPYFLAINRFVPKKNLFFLISAYAEYRQSAGINAWDLVLCGDGQLRPQIEKQIEQLGLENAVHLPGFLQQEELLPYFAHAGCFIHASIQEQWGLVVNEAMAASLPVLVSNRCGCFENLIVEGVNGFGFDPEKSEQLTNLMLKISTEEFDLNKMGQTALEHIQNFSPDYFAKGLQQAVEYAIAHS